MIFFLRKLRAKLVNQQKMLSYLAYAFGEILLVVIGILIALQVGDWKQQRTDRRLEKAYLERLIIDMDTDLRIANYIMETLETKAVSMSKVRAYVDDPTIILDDSVMINLKRSYIMGSELPNARLTGTFQELISTGNLSLIQNTDLRNGIVNFYSGWQHRYDRIESFHTEYITLILQIADRFNFFEDNPLYIGKPLKEVLTELKVEDLFYRYYMEEVNYMGFAKNTIETNKLHVEKTLGSIKEELERLK